jgi:dephospho-CoA kinase
MPFIVGLTGGIGSGKSAAAAIFAELGAEVVDTDAIAHELTAPGGAAIAPIREAFGDPFIAATGALDRGKMREAAFADPAVRKRLEAILHPLIRRVTEERTRAASGPYVIQVIPLLVESGQSPNSARSRMQRVLVVDCPEETQVARTIGRSGLTEDQVRAIMTAQASRSARLAAANDVIDNSQDLAGLRGQVAILHRRYLELAAIMPKA